VLRNIVPDPNLGLNLNAEAKVPGHLWGKDSKEDKVVFLGGELLSGVLDKSAFGASDFGLVHSVYELYGAETAGCLLGVLSRLFTKYLQHRAFTCRMDDLALTAEGNERRSEILRKGANLGTEAAIENFPSLSSTPKDEIPSSLRQLLEDVLRDDSKMAGLDMTVKTKLGKLTSSISDAVMPHGLLRKFPHNHMQTMTLSGAKGSAVNARQISCALGQQELEGRRVPVMVSGKTLPSFQAFETKAMAGGYIASRFLTGVKPQEFYFHCMAGREGLIDTAVKTSRSGYLQRCLIKHLEGIHVRYDNTVRGSDNSVYQFYYGGDGLDVTKQKHLYQFEFIARNEVSLATLYKPNQIRQAINEKEAAEYMKKVLKKSNVRPEPGARSQRDKYDPALSLYNPAHYLGSTSEQFAVAVMDYFKKNPHRLLRPKKGKEEEDTRLWNSRYELVPQQRLRDLLNIKYMRSLVEPGEAVGLLASQGYVSSLFFIFYDLWYSLYHSVGEPSTQMTLNTFHFAGHGAANVTLGIPRLREIVMTASQKPKTPSMTMKVRPDVSPEDVAAFCKRATRLTLSQVVSEVVVKERILLKGEARSTEFQVDVNFFPKAEYQVEYDITPSEILASFAIKFPLLLKKEMQLEMKRLDADLKNQIANLGKGSKSKGREGDEEDEAAEDAGDVPSRRRADDEISEVGDGDADATKRAQQKKQQVSYDEDDSEQDEDDESKPFNDEELEAQFEEEVEENDEPKVKTKLGKTLKNAVGAVEGLFQKNMPYATTFTFDEDHCSFQLEASCDLCGMFISDCQT
jgi:DNA-directed RNA polymerase I subunit RPA1